MASQGDRFRRRALSRGYKVDEVDDFLDRVEATLAGEPVGNSPVTANEVDDVVFRVRFGGYDEWQVDVYLDRVARQLAELEERGVLGSAPAPDYSKVGELEAKPEAGGFAAPAPAPSISPEPNAFAAPAPPEPNPGQPTTVMPAQRGSDPDPEGFAHLRADDDEGFGHLAPPPQGAAEDDPFAQRPPSPQPGPPMDSGTPPQQPQPGSGFAPIQSDDTFVPANYASTPHRDGPPDPAAATQQLPLAGAQPGPASPVPPGYDARPTAGPQGENPASPQQPSMGETPASPQQPSFGGPAGPAGPAVPPQAPDAEAAGFGAAYSDQRADRFSDTGSRRAAPVEPSTPSTPARGFPAPEPTSVDVPLAGGRRPGRTGGYDDTGGFTAQQPPNSPGEYARGAPPPSEDAPYGGGAYTSGYERGLPPQQQTGAHNPVPPPPQTGAYNPPPQHDMPQSHRGGFGTARAAAAPPPAEQPQRPAHPYEGHAFDPPGRHGREEMTTEMRSTDSPFSADDLHRLETLRRGFQPRRFGSGYDPGQVNRVFDAVTNYMTGRSEMPLGERELDISQFSLVQGGYFEAEVESALREIRDIFVSRGQMG